MAEPHRPRNSRLFFALWPDDALRARIDEHSKSLIERGGGRAVPVRNLHVTLLFLGAVPAKLLGPAKVAAAGVSGTACEIVFDRLEAWRSAGVLCLTSSRPPFALCELADALREALSTRGFKLEEQRFRPHLTLARDLTYADPIAQIAPLNWPVGEFALVESTMTKAGSEYAVLDCWKLPAPTTRETG